MHTYRKFLLAAALVAPLLDIHAQTLLSDFSTGANWGAPATPVGDTGTLAVANGVGNFYTTATPTGNQFSYMQYTGVALDYSTSWTIRVDVNYATPGSIFSAGSAQFLNLGLLVTPGTTPSIDTGTGLPTFDGYVVQSNLFSNGSGAYSRDFRTSLLVADTSADDGASLGGSSVSAPTATAVRLSYNAGTHVLSAGFDANGAAGGYSFTALSSQTVNVGSAWGMTGNDAFSLYLVGNSGWDEQGIDLSPSVALGQATFDNLTAVPEPSTYAAMFGVAALGLAVWRRRQQGTVA
jgi:hypothetical protein